MPRSPVDPKLPDSVVRITDFPGMSPGTDQNDNSPGLAWIQVNAVSLFPGELRARRGFQVVRFDQPPRSANVLVAASSVYIVSSDAGVGGGFALLGML